MPAPKFNIKKKTTNSEKFVGNLAYILAEYLYI